MPFSNIVCQTEGGPAGKQAGVAQLVEHVLGKDEVMGSIPISSWSRLMTSKAFNHLFNHLEEN